MTKLLLLDSNSLVNRAFYAIPFMSTKDGAVTNAVYGYLNMLARLIADQKPTHIAAVFDLKAPTFRHKMYDGYKATRKGMPEDLASQLPILKGVLSDMRIPILTKEGYEADDVIGTLAKRFGVPAVIVSGDKDVLQLVDGDITVLHTKRGVTDIKEYTPTVMREEGLTPAQVIDYKALAGDASDNIPGVPGVGEKTAKGLIEAYGSLDGVYAHIEEQKGKLKERLAENKELAYLSHALATIETDAPLACTLDELQFDAKFPPAFFETLARLEFRTLQTRFARDEEAPAAEAVPVFQAEEKEIRTLEELTNALNGVEQVLSFHMGKEIRFATEEKTEYKIAVSEDLLSAGLTADDAMDALKPYLENETVTKILFDAKDTMYLLQPYGVTLAPPYEDILLKCYLIDSTRMPKDADAFADRARRAYPASGMLGENAALDAALEKDGLTALYRDMELPLVGVLFAMEQEGFTVDAAVLKELSEKYTAELATLSEKIYENAGQKFNINSPQQLGKILYEDLGLKHGKKTKTGYSVAADILAELDHPIIPHILRYRQIGKLQSTYINGMHAVLNPKDHKAHTVFKQALTATGRLSSTEPNLQNIPVRTEDGREIRKMFVASPGRVLVTADYSQIELRLLAHFSEDPVLTEAYAADKDIHTITAAKVFGVAEKDVTKGMRRDAKAVNFGIIYGISAFGLANNMGIAPHKARIFQEKYFETYPSVKNYMDENVRYATENGYIRTLAGRIRYFPELRSPNFNTRSFGERAAMNMPLQGSASDIIKIAMLKVFRALEKGGFRSKLILQVHDELIVDAYEDEADAVAALIKENMETAFALRVPLIAEAKRGKNWFEVA